MSDHRAQRRTRIVQAAAEAVEEHGLGVGTAQIAERAGVARPHVYRHFDSKDDLDAEVARWAATALVEHVRPTLTRTGTPMEIIRGVIAAAVAWAEEHPNLYRFMAARQQTKALQRVRLGRTRFLGEVLEASAAYLRSTEAGVEAPPRVMAGLMGMVDASIIWWLDHGDEAREELVDRLSRQVWLVLGDLVSEMGVPIDAATVLRLPGESSG